MKNFLSNFCCFAFVISSALSSFAADWTDAEGNEYNALKYLKGNATANNEGGPWLVLTNITVNCSDTIKMKFNLDSTKMFTQALWCSRKDSSTYFMSIYNPTVNGIQFYRKTATAQQHSQQIAGDTDYTVIADYNTRKFSINGLEEELSSLSADTFTDLSPLMLFATYKAGATVKYRTNPNGNRAAYRFYYLQICSSDGKLRHNLIPATNTTANTVGLYDTVTQSFFTPDYSYYSYKFTTAEWGSDRAGKKWTGLGGDNKMSNAANWANNDMPSAGDDIDFTIAVPFAEIDADIEATFGKIYLGAADLPAFSGLLTATGINDLTRMQAYDTATEGFTFTLAAPSGQDFIWSGGAAANNWKATDVWTYNDTTSSWFDNNNAIFNTDNAMVALEGYVSVNSLVFKANATISGSGTLAVPLVTVDPDISATISASTAGTLEKAGEGSLTLSQNRSDATVLSDGTLSLTGEASLDWSKFTFGTDSAKPVALNLGPTATLSPVPATWNIGNVANITSTVVKTGGDWTFSGDVRIGSGAGSVASFYHNGGTISAARLMVGDDNDSGHAGTGYCEIGGGTVTCSGIPYAGVYSTGEIVVTNGGSLVCADRIYLGHNSSGTLTIANGGSVNIATYVIMCNNSVNSTGILNIRTGGTVTAMNAYRSKAGSATLNFDGGTFKKASGNGNFFPVNGNSTAINVTVSENGGTLDNNSLSVALPCTITGAGGMTLSGSGTTIISADQSYLGTTTVSNGTTLSVSDGVTFVGPVAFNEDSAFDIASATPGVASITAATLTLPATGTVPLTFAGGAFAEGIYTICSATGLTDADGEKFAPSTGDLEYSWSVANSALVLTVGDVDPNAWTGRGGDGRMSTPSNWGGSFVPVAGANIDLSGISADTTIIADAKRTFGAVKMGAGVITFTNSFAATSFSDTSKIAVGADSTVTVEGDLVFATNETCYICHSVATGGTFAVTGNIIAMAGQTGTLVPCYETVNEGVIASRGLINNAKSDDHFALARATANALVKWRIGEDGLSGTNRFFMGSRSGVHAMIIASTNFTISSGLVVYRHLTLDTAGYEITLGTNTLIKSGGILGGSANGLTTITGSGKVIVNYDVNHLSTAATSRTNAFTVAQGGTLAFKDGGNIGTGALTIQSGGTLEIMESATVAHNGTLQLEDGAALAFNFTSRTIEPQLALAEGEAVIFSEGESTNILVKVTGDVWPVIGEKLLTTCGNFDADGVNVSLADGAPKWAQGVSVEEGNIVLRVKPMPMSVIVR